MKKKNKKNRSVRLSEDFKLSALAAVIVLAVIFLVGGFSAEKQEPDTTDNSVATSVAAPTATQPTTQAPTTQSTAAPSTTATPQSDVPTNPSASSQDTTAPAADSGTPKTTAEIIAYFNDTANKVKTDAVKAVKNYEKRMHNEEHLIVPKVVEGMAADLMEKNFKDDTEPIVYATREEIVSEYQVPGVEWASQLTEAEVAEAIITDNGTEYEIMIKLHQSENPEPGQGVAKAFDTITSSEVMEKAPSFVTGFTTTYTNCVVKCKVDKATGHTTWSNYTSTVVLGVSLNFLGEHNAQIGMTFEKDYTITY